MKKILFCLLILILGGVVGSSITFVIINDDSNSIDETERLDDTSISITEFYPDSIALLVDGKVYVNVYGSTIDIDNLYGSGTFQTLLATRDNYKSYNFEKINYKDELNKSFEGLELKTSNVKDVYAYAVGQDLTSNYGLILLNDDGTVSIISLYSLITGNTSVTDVTSLSNIVSISSSDNNGYYTVATDNLGVLYNMSDYIPTDYTLW